MKNSFSSTPEQLIGAHLYLDIAKSDYLFHGYSGGMCKLCWFSKKDFIGFDNIK